MPLINSKADFWKITQQCLFLFPSQRVSKLWLYFSKLSQDSFNFPTSAYKELSANLFHYPAKTYPFSLILLSFAFKMTAANYFKSLKSWLELWPKLIHFSNRKCIYRHLSNKEILECKLLVNLILIFLFKLESPPQVWPLFLPWILKGILKKSHQPFNQIKDCQNQFFHLFFIKSSCFHCYEFIKMVFHF